MTLEGGGLTLVPSIRRDFFLSLHVASRLW